MDEITHEIVRTKDSIIIKQYDSWLKSNDAVMSRIPAQALAFAMVIKTAGFFPVFLMSKLTVTRFPPVFSTLRLLYSKLLYDSPYPKRCV